MSIGLPNGDLLEWLRRCCIVLSKATYTGIPFWLGLPLSELVEWILSLFTYYVNRYLEISFYFSS